MLLGTISFAILAIGTWAACRVERRVEQGRPSAHLESWCAGLLIIGGLALLGFSLDASLDFKVTRSPAVVSAFPSLSACAECGEGAAQ